MKLHYLAKPSFLFILTALAVPAFAAQVKPSLPGGVYCMANSHQARVLAVKILPDNSLKIGASFWTKGNNFSIYGIAHPSKVTPPYKGSWRYEENIHSQDPNLRCIVNIILDEKDEYYLAVDKAASCEADAGQNALVRYSLFPPMYRESSVTDQLDSGEKFQAAGKCITGPESTN